MATLKVTPTRDENTRHGNSTYINLARNPLRHNNRRMPHREQQHDRDLRHAEQRPRLDARAGKRPHHGLYGAHAARGGRHAMEAQDEQGCREREDEQGEHGGGEVERGGPRRDEGGGEGGGGEAGGAEHGADCGGLD